MYAPFHIWSFQLIDFSDGLGRAAIITIKISHILLNSKVEIGDITVSLL